VFQHHPKLAAGRAASARGTDGRTYPWGDVFDTSKCNSWEAGMGWTLIAEIAAIAALFAAAMWRSWRTARAHRRRRARPAEAPAEPDTTLAHAEVTVSWADGTRADWDRHVRPILAREFGHIVGARRSGAESARSRRATGELMFGPELWPLVDPTSRFARRRDQPGPGRAALGRILDRLEAA
jgi:hypothetical protein